MCALSDDPAKSSVVLDRALDQEKSLDPSGPSHKMSTIRLVAPQGRPLVLYLRPLMEHVRNGRSVPRLPPPVDLNPVPFLYPLVAAFRLVCAAMNSRLEASLSFTAPDAKIGRQIPQVTSRMAHLAA